MYVLGYWHLYVPFFLIVIVAIVMTASLSPTKLFSDLTPATQAILTTIAITVVTTALFTRLTTGKPESKRDGGRVPFMPGYWLPVFGHNLQMAWNADGFLGRMRDRSPLGAFALSLAGRRRVFVHKPSLVAALMDGPRSAADEEYLKSSSPGFSDEERSHAWFPDVHTQYERLASGPSLAQLVDRTVKNVKVHIVDLVTFNSYPSDQMEWERFADADIIETPDGQRFIEADLVPLIKNFVTKTANPALFGSDFDKNFDDTAQLLWAYEAAFSAPFATWLPSWLTAWVPRPAVQKARRARRTLLLNLEEYHEAAEKVHSGEEAGIRWQDLDDASTLIKERIKAFRKHDVSIRARAASDLTLLRAMHTNAAPLTFWLLYETLRDPVLVQQIREETAPHVKAVQPKNEFNLGVWVPPRVEHLDIEALTTQCPLLKSAYVETMRLYTGAWSTRQLSKGTVLESSGKGEDGCVLEGDGAYVHAPHGLHHMDAQYFPDPNEWHGLRHIRESVNEKGAVSKTADLGTIRPYGECYLLYTLPAYINGNNTG